MTIPPIVQTAGIRWRGFTARAGKIAPAALEQILFFGGLASITYGCWMIYHPAGPIVGGAIAYWLSMLISAERNQR